MKNEFFFKKVLLLIILVLVVTGGYFMFDTQGDFSFAFFLRGKKFLAFVLVAIATSFSTITFQTITQNHFLTPQILGLDSLYVLVQTISFFYFSGVKVLKEESLGQFLGTIFLLGGLSFLLAKTLFKLGNKSLFFLLMTGMILGTLFKSLASFLQVLLDPNEYTLLQGRLFASFANVNTTHLVWGALLILLLSGGLFIYGSTLDVFQLGSLKAQSLGVNTLTIQKMFFVILSVLTATATALVGPVGFLGFIIANLSYQYGKTIYHRQLFIFGTLFGLLFLVGGQWLVERVFHFNTPISVVVEFIGGLYFVLKILKERKKIYA